METVSNPTAARVLAVRAVGTTAVLAELAGLHDVLALQALLLDHPFPGQVDILAAAETVLIKADSPQSARRIAARLPELDLAVQAQAEGKLVQIDTVYDGEDLAEVGRLTGLGVEGVVAAHTGQVWTVAFGGFAPGFGYMVGENESLEVPRRSSPRTAVPAGSVALAGNYSAVYPRQSPGGWQLIGRTAARMWDLGREQPALAAPGDRVQFRAVRELVEISDTAAGAKKMLPPEAREAGAGSGLRILSPGLQSLIQDLGRHGPRRAGSVRGGGAGPFFPAPCEPDCGQPAIGRRRGNRGRRAARAGGGGPGARRHRRPGGTDNWAAVGRVRRRQLPRTTRPRTTAAGPGKSATRRWPRRLPCSTARC
jgi:KipI family sensor histidine kinase inhibitor